MGIDVLANTGPVSSPASICIQHEIDHLDGILFWDHVTQLKRNMLKRKLAKFKKECERQARVSGAGKSERP